MTKWSESFGRSKYGKAVWFDREGVGDNIIGALESRLGGTMFSGSGTSRGFADGGTSYYSNYTMSDANERGHRVWGWAALRFLCFVNGIDQPSRRLYGEPFKPEPELVARAVLIQLATMRETIGRGSPFPEQREPTPLDELPDQAKAFWELLAELHEGRVP